MAFVSEDGQKIADVETQIARVFEPYLTAIFSDESSGDDVFDRDVITIKETSDFLARKAVELLCQLKS